MSRSNYSDDQTDWERIRWRGAVASAIRGKRGQAFLRELLAAVDAIPSHRLIYGELVDEDGQVCALGAVALARGLDVSQADYDQPADLGKLLNIPRALAAEIVYENDEAAYWSEKPPGRYWRMRHWIAGLIK